jgi:hypothetical protein
LTALGVLVAFCINVVIPVPRSMVGGFSAGSSWGNLGFCGVPDMGDLETRSLEQRIRMNMACHGLWIGSFKKKTLRLMGYLLAMSCLT